LDYTGGSGSLARQAMSCNMVVVAMTTLSTLKNRESCQNLKPSFPYSKHTFNSIACSNERYRVPVQESSVVRKGVIK